jgi:hypothetical protein
MSTIVFDIAVTYTGLTATTIPSPTGNRTVATGDDTLRGIAEQVRRYIANQFLAVDPQADTHTAVVATIT